MRLAFIGGIGHHYLRHCVHDSDPRIGRPIAVCSDGFDAEVARKFAAGLNVETIFFDDPRVMFEQFKPDVVSVGAVYARNGEWAIESMSRGCPTISDKPIASTCEQLARLRDLSNRPGAKPLITEFDFRARPEFLAARQAVRSGAIGKVVLATGQKSYRFGTRPAWYADRSLYPGTLMWILCHSIDVIAYTTGLKYQRFIGAGGNVSKPDFGTMEDHVAILAEMEGGATALAHADFLRPAKAATHGDDRLRLAGSLGVIEVRDTRCKLITHEQAEIDLTNDAPAKSVHGAMLDAVLGQDDSIYSTKDSLRTAELLLKAREASDRREWVSV